MTINQNSNTTVFGLPQPSAEHGRANEAPLFLPASEGYHTVHHKYVESCMISGNVAAKYHSFRLIWLRCVPHIKFMTLCTDVCQTCEDFHAQTLHATSEVDKLLFSRQFQDHVTLAQKERQFYLESIQRAEKCSLNTSSGSVPSYSYFTFDFAPTSASAISCPTGWPNLLQGATQGTDIWDL